MAHGRPVPQNEARGSSLDIIAEPLRTTNERYFEALRRPLRLVPTPGICSLVPCDWFRVRRKFRAF
eukprot:2709596-Pyramimonas_sp.AAC.1